MNYTRKLPVLIVDSVCRQCSFSTKSPKTNYVQELLLKLPREPKRTIEQQSPVYVPGTVNLQVLGSGAFGAPATLYLFTKHWRCLFNCGEGTQRLALQHKIKLTRLENIFFTRASWDRTGGLPGLSVQLQEIGTSNLTLYGPDGLGNLFHAMKRFVRVKKVRVEARKCRDGLIYEDQVLSVVGVSFEKTDQSLNDDPQKDSKILPIDDTNECAFERQRSNDEISNSSDRCTSTVMSFICHLKSPNKEVPSGALLGELENAKDVCSATDSGPIFIILDIPSVEFLDSFKDKERMFASHQQSVSVVVHFSPQKVIDNPVYQNFLRKFPKSTTHLVVNETNKFSGFLSSHRLQSQLNQLNENVFPILSECYTNTKSHPMYEQANTSTCYHLRPNKGLDRQNERNVRRNDYLAETTMIPGFVESLNDLKKKLNENYVREKKLRADEYPKIVFLGTASCVPRETRNVSSILVRTTPTSNMLLDCGEGTFGQLFRFYGKNKAIEILRNLKAIYVSHLHADHHLGLIGLLQERRRLLPDASPVMLLAPSQISLFLDFYDRRIDAIRNEFFLVPNGNLLEKPLSNEQTTELGLNYISTCLVYHCPHAFGVAFETTEQFKLTYSGDSVPCNELVRLGKDSTLLIHEATMEDEFVQLARQKNHSTVSQAIEQGIRMNAKHTLLTHFRQWYAKIPTIDGEMRNNVGFAFDNMEVSRVDLEYLHLVLPTLKLLFNERLTETNVRQTTYPFG